MDTYRSLSSIRSTHWQPKLGAPGSVVEGIDDIAQSIRIILLTPKGSDRHRPEFGSNLHKYLDWPIDRVTPHLVRESVEAIRTWEKRANVQKVSASIHEEHIKLTVKWCVDDGVIQLSEVVYERIARS